MLYREELKGICDDLMRKRAALAEELKTLPEGELYIMRRKSGDYFCERFPKKGNRKKEVRKGITKDADRVNALVRKKYVLQALEKVEFDIDQLNELLRKYKPIDENTVMRDFVHKYPNLTGGIYNDLNTGDEWAVNYERQRGLYEAGLTSVAGDRTPMRSRGEILIAEKLRQYDIPFRFECPIGIPEIPYVPDFTVKRPRDGKIFYWEHIGDVNDKTYMDNNERKLDTYKRYNIVPWDNLIITYDLANGGVNVPLIEGMIHAWIL